MPTISSAPVQENAVLPTAKAFLYCPMCTHTVSGEVQHAGRRTKVKPGQTCPRCRGALDAAYVLRLDKSV